MKAQEKRNRVRNNIRWPVHVRGSDVILVAADALDCSSSGIFVRQKPGEPKPAMGKDLVLTIFPNGTGNGVRATGVVRWSGQSREHQCDGVGIAFETPVKSLNRVS
jgi:hypothetical protein